MAFSLDGWGRIVAVHTPEGGVERYTYDHAGNITSTTDANGGTITYDYNSMGKVYQVTDQEGRSEYFHYDAEGRLETRTDRNGNCTRKTGGQFRNEYAYDRMNRLVQTIQDGKTERFTYDLAGNRLMKESGIIQRTSSPASGQGTRRPGTAMTGRETC